MTFRNVYENEFGLIGQQPPSRTAPSKKSSITDSDAFPWHKRGLRRYAPAALRGSAPQAEWENIEKLVDFRTPTGDQTLNVRANVEAIMQAIKRAYGAHEPIEAIRSIDDAWGHLEDGCSLAESRMRILLHKVATPLLAPEPSWFTVAIDEMIADIDDVVIPQKTIDSCRLLTRALLGALATLETTARIDAMPNGSIEMHWQGANLLIWVISNPSLAWPGVNVRVYTRPDPTSPQLTAKTFHHVSGVIDQARKHFDS